MVNNNNLRKWINSGNLKGNLLTRARKKGDIIFGAQAIKKQIGLKARRTVDFDIFTKDSKQSAINITKSSNKITRGKNFFVKKGMNPGTYKVKNKGKDGIAGTEDDSTLVDFTTTPKRKIKTVIINQIRYRALSEELKAKNRILKDKAFAFRRAKDLEDRNRILMAGRRSRK